MKIYAAPEMRTVTFEVSAVIAASYVSLSMMSAEMALEGGDIFSDNFRFAEEF